MTIGYEDGCVTNIPTGKDEPPAGEPWIIYLFCWKIREYVARRKGVERPTTNRRIFLTTLEGVDEDSLNGALEKWVDDNDAIMVDSKGHTMPEVTAIH